MLNLNNFFKRKKLTNIENDNINNKSKLARFLFIELITINSKSDNLNYIEFLNYIMILSVNIKTFMNDKELDYDDTYVNDVLIILSEIHFVLSKWHNTYSFWYTYFKSTKNEKFNKMTAYPTTFIHLDIQEYFHLKNELHNDLIYVCNRLIDIYNSSVDTI